MKINPFYAIGAMGIFIVVLTIFSLYTAEGRAILEWVQQNGATVIIAVLLLAAFYFYLLSQSKNVWLPCWEVFDASCENRNGGLYRYGFKPLALRDKVMPTKVEPFLAYLFVGTFFDAHKCSFLLTGTKPPKGDIIASWDYALSDRQIRELQKQGISLEEAFAKIAEIKKANESISGDEEL